MKREEEGGNYRTYYYKKMISALMHMYRTAKVDILKNFGAELSQFVLGIRMMVAKDTQTRGVQCEAYNSPLSLPIYRLMCETMFSSPNPEHIFLRAFLTVEWSLMDRVGNCFARM